jgi:hypothetical protein
MIPTMVGWGRARVRRGAGDATSAAISIRHPSWCPRRAPTALVLALLTLGASSLRPTRARADSLIVESWVGGPSPQEKLWLGVVREGLEGSGFLVSSVELARALGPRRPFPALEGIPGQVDLMGRFSAVRASLDDAISLYRRSRFEAAEKLLTEIVGQAQRNPLIFASQQGRPVLRKAIAYLALSLARNRRSAAADATSEELVRTSPGEGSQIFIQFGPQADKLYRAAEARLDAQSKGTLLVEVDEPEAVVIVNEGATSSRAFEARLPPGTYRVLVKTPGAGARRYEVPVAAGETTRLAIEWRLDRALAFSERSAALVFDSERARGEEGAVAVALARAAGAGPRAIVLGARSYDGHPAISASLYDVASGGHVATALAVMNGQLQDAKLAALKAFFLSGGRATSPNLVVSERPLPGPTATAPPPLAVAAPPSPPPRPGRGLTYVVAASALAAFGAGVAVTQLADERAAFAEPTAYALFGASVALASYAAYRWALRGERPTSARPSLGAAVIPARGGVVGAISWGF